MKNVIKTILVFISIVLIFSLVSCGKAVSGTDADTETRTGTLTETEKGETNEIDTGMRGTDCYFDTEIRAYTVREKLEFLYPLHVEWGDTVELPARYKVFDDCSLVAVKVIDEYSNFYFSGSERMKWLSEKAKITLDGKYDDIILVPSGVSHEKGTEAIIFAENGGVYAKKDSSPIPDLYRIAVYLTEDSAVYSSSFLCKYREYRETYFREELCAPCVFPIENGALRMPVERAKFDDMEKLVEYSEPRWITSSIADFCYIVEILDRYSEKTGDNFTFADGMTAEQFDTYMKKAMEIEFSFYKDDLGLNVY